MEIRNLVTFLKVTELNSFSKAAEALDYSQSAVTVQIQQLERELGVRLFDRIGKNVSITQYGKNFISYARDIVSAVARAQVFASEETELTGMVQVGTLNSLMTASFSDIVPAFRQRFPHVMMRLHADMVASLKDKLLKNELDLIYTLDSQVLDPQFVKVFEAEEEVVVVTNRDNPLAARESVRLAELVDHPFILMNRTNAYRDLFDTELARQGLEIRPFLELEDDVLALRLLYENPAYMTVLPLYTVKKSIHEKSLAAVRVEDCKMSQFRQVIYHKNKVLTPQIQGMLDTIVELFGEDERIVATLDKDTTGSRDECLIEIYRKLRPGDPPTVESAESLLDGLFFDRRRYDISNVGRYKFNKKLSLYPRIAGFELAEPVADPLTGELLAEAGQVITRDMAKAIDEAGVISVYLNVEGKKVRVFSNGMVNMARFVDFDPA